LLKKAPEKKQGRTRIKLSFLSSGLYRWFWNLTKSAFRLADLLLA